MLKTTVICDDSSKSRHNIAEILLKLALNTNQSIIGINQKLHTEVVNVLLSWERKKHFQKERNKTVILDYLI